MKQLDKSGSKKYVVMSAMIFLFLAIGAVLFHAGEKAGVSKAVFYVA